MSEPKLISPLLDNFIMGDPISDHHGVRCCPAMAKDSDDKFIVKIISIPASQTKLEALLLTGAYSNVEAAEAYFKDLVKDLVGEIEVLQTLSHQEGFVACEGYQVVPMDDGTGFDIYILTKYRRSLQRHCQKSVVTHLEALNLALDMCSALTACRRSGYLYVDLRPENIFITENKEYRIGDLGFVGLNFLKYASLPEKYQSAYTAPEITDAFSALNESIDIYALGMVLYQIYNGGTLPENTADTIPAPAYADSEVSQIILKALDPNPDARWENPAQMGQAVVSYMQRNGAADSPIIITAATPPSADIAAAEADLSQEYPVDTELLDALTEDVVLDCDPAAAPETIEPSPAEELAAAEDATSVNAAEDIVPVETQEPAETQSDDTAQEEAFENLSFLDDPVMDASDEHSTPDAAYDEVSQMLAQADALAELTVPDPVVAPEPIDVPVPPPPSLEDETGEEISEETSDTLDDVSFDETILFADEAIEDEVQEPVSEVVEYDEDTAPKPKKRWGLYVALIIIGVLLLTGGFLFYRFYYLQPIDDLTITGNKDKLTVTVTTDVDDEMLTVVCQDALYGTSIPVPVVDGQAQFTGLKADTEYKITVQIKGFHQLIGKTSDSYFTPDETAIIQFDAATGAVDGSVTLGFTLDGQDSEGWTIVYSASGEEEKTVSFTGHSVTIPDLTVGTEYTATLQPDSDLFLTGTTQISFVASKVIQAENVAIASLTGNQLVATWHAPEGTNVDGWKVRCYNGSDYDKTITTNDTSAIFTNLDHTNAFTVEVTAIGQTTMQSAKVGANSVTITDLTANTDVPGTITLTWESTSIPAGGWVIQYTVEGMDVPQSAETESNTVSIISALPGLRYTFSIQAADETPVVHTPISCTTEAAKNFQREYLGYTVSRNNLSFGMCRTPKNENWSYKDVPGKAYTRAFEVNERASFVIFLNRVYGSSSEMIHTTFAFYDEDDKLVDICTSSRTWSDMWYKNYCEMDIPRMPTQVGSYTVRIYFNGEYVTTQSFSIVE